MGEVAVNVAEGEESNMREATCAGFLPCMFIRVLLVEGDDSTRHIITALLRKCSYKVAAVADGLKAWETLMEKSSNIDLILTEVELPSVSGFGLLTKIMEHEICKSIPVIMMSKHDSISTVFKCMLRGAADFLVKPIRKNELRNLWQHVWRRNSGSCTKPDMEAESANLHNMQDPLHQRYSSGSPAADTNEKMCEEQVKLGGAPLMDGDRNGDKPMKPQLTFHNKAMESVDTILEKRSACPTVMLEDEAVESSSYKHDSNIMHKTDGHNGRLVEPSEEAIDLIGAIDNQPQCSYQHKGYTVVKGYVLKDAENVLDAKDGTCKLGTSPLLELSLRRTQPDGCQNQEFEDKHTLNHSNASAFSRYINRRVQPPFQSSASSTEPQKVTRISYKTLTDQGCANSCDPEWIGTLQNNNREDVNCRDRMLFPHSQLGFFSVPVPGRGLSLDGLSSDHSVVRPVFCTRPGFPPWGTNSTSQQEAVHVSSSNQSNPGVHYSEQNRHECDQSGEKPMFHDVHRQQSEQSEEDPGYISSTTSQSGTAILCNTIRGQFNGNVCGSAHNGSNRTSAVAVAGVTVESGNDEGILACDGSRNMVDFQNSSHREEALTKFRLKRKYRCYEKKVRYQSRKKLAEQRPRVKGQFVRQVQLDPHAPSMETDGYCGDSLSA